MPAYNETVDAFGTEILSENGEINRRYLGSIVFTDTKRLASLNKITHKYIIEEIKRKTAGDGKYVIDASLPNTFGIECNMVVAVSADEKTRLKRIMKRDNITLRYAKNRLSAQLSDDEYRKMADVVIVNNGNIEIESLEESIKNLSR